MIGRLRYRLGLSPLFRLGLKSSITKMVAIKSLAAIAALSLVNSVQAWYTDLPSCLAPFDPFVYTGCYDNGQPGEKEALSLRTDLDQQNMTVEGCVAHCKGE